MAQHQESTISVPVTFRSLLRLAPWAMGSALVSGILSGALSIAPFWFIYLIVVELFEPVPDSNRIWLLAFVALSLFLLRWGMMAASHVAAHWGAYQMIYRLRLELARQLGRVPLSFFSNRGSGSLRRTLHDDVGGLEGFYAHILPDTVAAASVPVCTLILLFFADWRLALAVIAPLPLAFVAQSWMTRHMGERMSQWADLQKNIANQVGEYLRCIGVIKSFGLDARSFGRLEKEVRGAVDWVEDYAKSSTGGFIIFSGVLRSSLVLVVPLGAWFYLQGQLDLPTYVLFLLISPLVLEPLLRLMFALHEILHKIQAMERINDILQAEILPSTRAEKSLPITALDIEFNNVSHHYDERRAIEHVSFIAKTGEITAIVGPSGSGKSTILRLIARLYDRRQGHITLGQRDLHDWPLDEALAQMAVVFQDVFLFSGTVRDNLKLAQVQATDAQIEAACLQAQAHDFITALPQGYDTQLGENGARLSGGERQRLSIARALLKDAPILLLDEAMASLDGENEHLVRQALDELCRHRTVLMICHNLQSAMTADQVLVMQEGQLVACGRHCDLLQQSPLYQTLWRDHEQAQAWGVGKNQGEMA